MPDQPIRALPDALPLADGDFFAVDQAAPPTAKATLGDVADFVQRDTVDVVGALLGVPLSQQLTIDYDLLSGGGPDFGRIPGTDLSFDLPADMDCTVIASWTILWENQAATVSSLNLEFDMWIDGVVHQDVAYLSMDGLPYQWRRLDTITQTLSVALSAGTHTVQLGARWNGVPTYAIAESSLGHTRWLLLPYQVARPTAVARGIERRITEAGDYRITEGGEYRILE